MATYVISGGTTRITVEFRDFDGELLEMELVEGEITEASATPVIDTFEPQSDEPGVYYYDWVPVEEGEFIIRFIGWDSSGNDTIVEETFVVVSDATPSSAALGTDYEFTFIADVDNLYVDPEEILLYYPDASMINVLELINKFSNEAKSFIGDEEPDILAIDYVRAATLCSLSRIFDDNAGTGDETITLGDLSVSKSSKASAVINMLTRANASTWCELAVLFRTELMRNHVGMKSVVKSLNHKAVIPSRLLKERF